MNTTRESFVLHHETGEMVQQLSDDKAGKFIKAIFTYSMTGEVMNVAPSIRQLYQGTINTLNREFAKYEETCARNKRAADKRWEKQREEKERLKQSSIGTIDEVPMAPKNSYPYEDDMRAYADASQNIRPHTNGTSPQCREESRHAESCYPNPKPNPNPEKKPKPNYDPVPDPDLEPYGGNAAAARIPAEAEVFDDVCDEIPENDSFTKKKNHPSEFDQETFHEEAHGPHKNVMLTFGQYESLYHYDRILFDQELKKLSNELAKGKTFEGSHFDILNNRLTTQRIIAKNVRYD
ncbi:MAG: hypothetical protein IKV45_01660 [Firmicutes bacterium]|nr:hypothetical protein [Bacillota bacterium]